eukprot:7825223-Pyramimonas_sp.AAC.1
MPNSSTRYIWEPAVNRRPGYRQEPRRALVCKTLLGTHGESFLTRELKSLKNYVFQLSPKVG